MSTVCSFSLITVKEFLHKFQHGVGRWSKKAQILSTELKHVPYVSRVTKVISPYWFIPSEFKWWYYHAKKKYRIEFLRDLFLRPLLLFFHSPSSLRECSRTCLCTVDERPNQGYDSEKVKKFSAQAGFEPTPLVGDGFTSRKLYHRAIEAS